MRRSSPSSGIALMLALLPARSAASDLTLTPSASLASLYDNSFFAPSDRDPVLSTRIAPRIGAALQAQRFAVAGGYGVDAAFVADDGRARPRIAQHGFNLHAEGRATARLALETTLAFIDTASAFDRLLTPSLDRKGRAQTGQLDVAGTYSSSERSSTRASYLLLAQQQATVLAMLQQGRADLRWRLTPRITAVAATFLRQFFFDDRRTVWSTAAAVGVEHAVTRWLSLGFLAGPRWRDSGWYPEASAALRLERPSTRILFEVASTETVLAGHRGVVRAERATASLHRELFAGLAFVSEPIAWRGRSKGLEVTTLALASGPRWSPAPWLTVFSTAQFAIQRQDTSTTAPSTAYHTRLIAGVEVTSPPEESP